MGLEWCFPGDTLGVSGSECVVAHAMTPETTPRSEAFTLKTPLLAKGRSNRVLAATDLLTLRVKVYAEGGENALHTHLDEDHAFIVLEGQGTFHDEQDTRTVVNQYEGIVLPRGSYYYFQSTGSTNLVLLRVGAGRKATSGYRRNLKGLETTDAENKHEIGVPIPGRFFAG